MLIQLFSNSKMINNDQKVWFMMNLMIKVENLCIEWEKSKKIEGKT